MFQTTNPDNAATIQRIESALSEVPMGETIGYIRLNEIAGRNVQKQHRHLLRRAQELAERNLGCCFESVRDVGIQRVPSADIPNVGLAAVRKCRRAARRGKKRIDRVNTNSLTTADQRRVIGYSAMLGAIALIADGRKAQAIATVADPVKPIPPANILDMFRT